MEGRKKRLSHVGICHLGVSLCQGVDASEGVFLTTADLPVFESEAPCECPLRAKASLRRCSCFGLAV